MAMRVRRDDKPRKGYWVVAKTGRRVNPGDAILDFRGEEATYLSGLAPIPGSSGKVVVSFKGQERTFFPTVFGLEWKEIP